MKLRIYNKTLEPNIWNEDKTLKPDISDGLLKYANDFYKSTGLKGEIHDVLMLGSCTNYNWNPNSDLDLHIVIDIANERINEEYARKFMDGLAFKWNSEHDVEVKGHPVEIYLQDIREPNSNKSQAREGASIYSLARGEWVLEPNPQNIKIDADKIRNKFRSIKKKIDLVIKTEDDDRIKGLMKFLKNYRNSGLSEGGEFSVENIVFKALRKSGDLAKIKDAIKTIYDRKMSIPENGHMVPDKKTEPLDEDEHSIEDLIKMFPDSEEQKPYTLVGWITSDGDVKSEIDYDDQKNHGRCVGYRYGHTRWRYNSKRNTVYFLDDEETPPTEVQMNNILHHLRKKYGITNPKTGGAVGYMRHGHYIHESLLNRKANLYLGFIKRDNFNVVGTDVEDEEFTHEWFQRSLGNEWINLYDSEFIPWRYKRSENTVFWNIARTKPSDDEKEAVERWLKDNVNIKYPEHKFTGNWDITLRMNRDNAHRIDEIVKVYKILNNSDMSLFFPNKK